MELETRGVPSVARAIVLANAPGDLKDFVYILLR